MEVKGKTHFISDEIVVTDTFKKRELVLEIAENPLYPELVKFEVIQDKCSLLDELRVGDDVEVFFNLKGREWTNKQGEKQYFNTLQLWKVNVNKTVADAGYVAPKHVDISSPADDDSDLPFS